MKLEKIAVDVTVKNNLCIGCGVCDPSCPFDAIDMIYNSDKEYRPLINDKCTMCGICYAVCPMAVPNLTKRTNEATRLGKEYGLYGVTDFGKGFEIKYEDYIRSSSGGILTALLKYLLEKKYIDAVVHVEQNPGNSENVFYKASVSKTISELDEKRSSFYHPIDFSEVLHGIKNDEEVNNVAITGTPCVVTALRQLKTYNKKIGKKIKYIFSLICSHNVSGQFTEMLAESFGAKKEQVYFKYREKVGIDNAGNFKNSVRYLNGNVVSNSRFDTPFTDNWRSFSYAFHGCLYCPDFFGVDADGGFKDAWNLKEERKEGETAYFIRNPEISELMQRMISEGILYKSELTKENYIKSQQNSILLKTYYAFYKQKRNKNLKKGVNKELAPRYSLLEKIFLFIDIRLKKFNLRYSKRRKRRKGKVVPRRLLKIFEKVSRKMSVYLGILYKLKENNLRKEVLYTAGFGHNNIGDEAQLSTNLSLWKEIAPDYKVTILSPRPDYTREVHGNYDIMYASRNSFWGFRNISYAGIGSRKIFKLFFKLRFFKLKIDTFFVKYFNRAFFISPESLYLLKRIKQAKVLHIGGGGYLTGKTFSRLFDYMGLIHIANKLRTDIILSGHNIGIWKDRYQKRIARKLKKAKYIGLRDSKNSVDDLKLIGVYKPEKVFSYFDDALFCEGYSKDDVYSFFKQEGISIDNGYITVNVHFWQALNKKTVYGTIEKLASHIDKIASKHNKIIFLMAMHEQDISPLRFLKKSMKQESFLLSHNDNIKLVVGVFHNSDLTITMKHHPIIFSMAGSVPTISVAFEDYSNHKNIGAMSLFGQEKYAVNYKSLDTNEFKEKLEELIKNRNEISDRIKARLSQFEKDKGAIIKKYTENY